MVGHMPRAWALHTDQGIQVPAKSSPTFQKRQKETARQQRQQEKAAARIARRDSKPKAAGDQEEDPDLAGIVPGPQPIQF